VITFQQRRFQKAQSQYRETELTSRIEGATPHALVSLMYEQLLQSLDVMLTHHSLGHTMLRDKQYERARSILVSLQASLDFEKGGELAARLGNIYAIVSGRLEKSIREQDGSLLLDVRAGLASIADAWDRLPTPQRQLDAA
jgi:flagellar secretion chaperone FliS